MGLRSRIVVIAAGSMLLAVVLIVVVSNSLFSREYRSAQQSRALAIATGLHVQLDRVLQLGLPLPALIGFEQQLQEAVNKYEGIQYAAVVDRQGRVLFHSVPWGEDGAVQRHLSSVLGQQVRALESYSVDGRLTFVAIDPVIGLTREYEGSVLVGFSGDIIAAKVRAMAFVQAGLALLVLAFVISALVLALSALVTRPLSRLLAAIEMLRQRRMALSSRLDNPGPGDIGRVARAFNGLMQDLETTSVSKAALEDAMDVTREAEQRYRLVVESSPSAILVERNQQLVFVNPAAIRLLGADRAAQLLGQRLLDFVHPESRRAVEEYLARLVRGASVVREEDVRFVRRDGELLEVEFTGNPFSYEGQPAVQVVLHDVTEARHKAAELAYLARHDALTGLPNRRMLVEKLDEVIAYAQRYGHRATVVYLDLDNFKIINDSLGHEQGDELLKTCASRLSSAVRELDSVARPGGDEFVVILLNSMEGDQPVIDLLERLQHTLRAPFVLDGHEYTITASLGFASYPADGMDAETLLRNADEAMFRAKEMGRDNFQPFSQELHARITARLALENDLRQATQNGNMVVYYQPQADVRSGHVIGFEALVRWLHPTRGLVMPGDFIRVAEETGLIVDIGEFVLRTACVQAKAWHATDSSPLVIAVNLSARQFWEPNLPGVVEKALRASGLEPGRLELELTESLVMLDIDRAIETMAVLRKMGVSLAIDDFGTGYSSLQALQRFPISRLKIAQEFLREIPKNPDSMTLARSIIALGHNMKFKVIAEGVETPEQRQFLQDAGCDEIQGYLLSPPMPQDQVAVFLRRQAGG